MKERVFSQRIVKSQNPGNTGIDTPLQFFPIGSFPAKGVVRYVYIIFCSSSNAPWFHIPAACGTVLWWIIESVTLDSSLLPR
jgi:hypothetical protein